MPRTLTPAEIRGVLSRAVTITLCGLDAAGQLIARPMHAAVVGDLLVFHGGTRGAKHGLVGQSVVATATEIVARIPSWFTDPVRACPASTLYRSVEVRGRLMPIEEPDAKAAALHAYSMAEQPEGGFETVRMSDSGYAAQLDRLVVAGLDLSGAVGRGKLAGEKPRGWRKRVAAGLWQRGAPGDIAAIECLRAEAPDTPLPAAYSAPKGVRLTPGGTAHLPAAVEFLLPQYWNRGISRTALEQAHHGSDAWVVAMNGDHLVGTARAVGDGAKTVWIYDVAVVPAWQGQGVGRALMNWLHDHPQVRDARRVILRTQDAHGFYRQLGYTAPPPRTSTPMWHQRR